ncbi:hypothetical protein MIND_00041800 [Mycena indigotica]|uniref:Uncharacterized protein n=1 Tax=Mycena indigotica TaxID=2126181 RepID=A0A8H6TDG7_9AGAR|nr:uncharacterized protein MIND_00041800 [Mycena indigotica]KAF7315274.1 hypothetical protein MIND_00041800 [Mycena indigotica]
MSLDQNLFTLIVTPSTKNPNVVDLHDPMGNVHYRKQRTAGQFYLMQIYDPHSEALLVSVTAPSATSKAKVLELSNPSATVDLKSVGTLTFRWSFKWEDHEFEWKREECYLLRKPDPPVLVALTKEPPGRLKTTSIQILDYNINRFDVQDRKGLEIVILAALLTFHDQNDIYHSPPDSLNSMTRRVSMAPTSPVAGPVPELPPKPQRTGIDRIAELQALRNQFNEVTVADEGSVEDYGAYCSKLFEDDAMLFITVQSDSSEHVPKVLQVVEETKRIRHKAGIDQELHQYVLHDTQPRKGPRRINLDDMTEDKYKPPESLTVHLSKIPMPELQPKAKGTTDPKLPVTEVKPESRKEQKKREESKRKEDKKANNARIPPINRLTRPTISPSPSQLNNPAIYAAPPPDIPQRKSGFFGDMFHKPRSSS